MLLWIEVQPLSPLHSVSFLKTVHIPCSKSTIFLFLRSKSSFFLLSPTLWITLLAISLRVRFWLLPRFPYPEYQKYKNCTFGKEEKCSNSQQRKWEKRGAMAQQMPNNSSTVTKMSKTGGLFMCILIIFKLWP